MLPKRKKVAGVRRRAQLMEGQDDISFRRSRTMQGTTSSNVKAVNQDRAELKSERLKKQQHATRKKRIIVAIGFTIGLVLSATYLVSQYVVSVSQVVFEPTVEESPSSDLYMRTIDSYLNERPSERFHFALDKKRLAQYVSQQLPEVKSIKSSSVSGNQAQVVVELRKPIVGWKIGEGQAYVDGEGVAFNNNYFTDPTVSVVDNSGASTDQGGNKVVASERFLRFLGRLVALTNTSGLGEVKEASLPRATTRQIDIKLKDRPYLIKTHIDRDPAATVEDIKRVVGYLDQKKLTPGYIDVRVSGRAFYK